ncbi:hypothetical protein XENOCAPTIV_029716, partial [Xenoophorus captivus]
NIFSYLSSQPSQSRTQDPNGSQEGRGLGKESSSDCYEGPLLNENIARPLTGVGQQVGGQQAWEPRVQQSGAFLHPCTGATFGRTAGTGAAEGETQINYHNTE